MRRFLLKLGITTLTIIVVAWGLDLLITHNLQHSDARMFHTYNAIYSDTLQCDAVVMGSSRGQVQFDVRILDSVVELDCYNLSVDGRCIDAEATIYNVYRHHAPKPKIIIQNIDWSTIYMSNGYEREQYLPYLNKDDLYKQIYEREGFSWADRWLPLVRYAGYRNVIFEGLRLPAKMAYSDNIYKGYIAVDALWDGYAFAQIDTIDFTIMPEAVDIFDNYLAQCQKEGIHIVMVYAPIYIGVTRKMGPSVDSMFAFYQSFADRYGCNILNYTYDSLCYDTLNFYNANHMNRRGAEQFSAKLARDLRALIYQSNCKTSSSSNTSD